MQTGPFSAYSQVGLRGHPGSNGAGTRTVTSNIATQDEPLSGLAALVDPHNPLLWFGVFLLVTVGAASVAGSVKLGKAQVSASVGSA